MHVRCCTVTVLKVTLRSTAVIFEHVHCMLQLVGLQHLAQLIDLRLGSNHITCLAGLKGECSAVAPAAHTQSQTSMRASDYSSLLHIAQTRKCNRSVHCVVPQQQ
jgi:hypothetical protein